MSNTEIYSFIILNVGGIMKDIPGGELDRSFIKWDTSRELYEAASRAVNENRAERYASVKDFYEAWLKMSNTEKI